MIFNRKFIIILLLQAPVAFACGYCVEDKVASAYDHAVVTRALGRQHHVAFFHVEGRIAPGEAARLAVQRAVESAAGVDRGSVRFMPETATLSFSFDPRKAQFGALHGALERRLAASRLALLPLQVMERPAELKAARR
jgi:hypothetical protein